MLATVRASSPAWLVVALVACGNARAPASSSVRGIVVPMGHGPPAPSAIEGSVIDNNTYAPQPNVTIIVEDHGQEWTAVSDASGQYSIPLPRGTYVVSAYYQDASAKPRIVGVRPHEATRLDLELDVTPVEDRDLPQCQSADEPQATDADVDELVAAVLARSLADPGSAPGWNLLPHGGPIELLAEVRDSHRQVPTAALPRLARPFVPRSRGELLDAANAARGEIPYVYFDAINIDRSCATVEVGVGEMQPANEPPTGPCCCDAIDMYQKRTGAWLYVGRFHRHCS